MEYKHYPFLDRETEIAGLELFDIMIVLVFPAIFSILVFLLTPFKIVKIAAPFIFFILTAILFVIVRRKKSGKEKGYIYRQIVYRLIGIKRIY